MDRREFNKNFLFGISGMAMPSLIYGNSKTLLMKKCKKPKRLSAGDTIGLIAPSSSITDAKLEKAIGNMESLGLKVKLGKYVKEVNGYLAGTDAQRLEDLHSMFADDSVDGIWCIRGGYGATRILPKINFKLIKKNPKVFIGYSDITAFTQAIFQETGLICFHGPVASSTFSDYTVKHLKAILMEPTPTHTFEYAEDNDSNEDKSYRTEVIRSGRATGELVGGNLTLLASMVGTKFHWDVKNKLVFIEDIGEKPYRIDRMLTQLLQTSNFEKAAGVILGVFEDCEADSDDRSLTLMETLKGQFEPLGIPVIYGLSFGHIKNHFVMPLGIKATMDTEKRTVTLLDTAVE